MHSVSTISSKTRFNKNKINDSLENITCRLFKTTKARPFLTTVE